MNQNTRSLYAYGWLRYKKILTGILDLQGKPTLGEEIRIYNAVDRDPELSLSIKGEKYVWSPHDPEPDPTPELPVGTRYYRRLSATEAAELAKKHVEGLVDKTRAEGKPTGRSIRRAAERNAKKFVKGRCAVFTITEPPAEK